MSRELRCGRFMLPLDRPLVMGVINVTPDSFSDGGRHAAPDQAISHARALAAEGADLLDIGAESTRPRAEPVPLSEELDRLLPVLEGVRNLDIPISVDTYKPATMRAALAAGASMINDITALQAEGALEAMRDSNCGICLMHMQGTPQTMQLDPRYGDVVAEVSHFLAQRVAACERAGIARERLVLDPGFGFGKTKEHNLTLLRNLSALRSLGLPLLAGLSRKSSLGKIAGKMVLERVGASVAAALLAVERGATIVRVHDVGDTRDALLIFNAVQGAVS